MSEQLLKLIAYNPIAGLSRKKFKRAKGGRVYNRDHIGRFSGGAVQHMADGGSPTFAPDAVPEPIDAAPVFPADAKPEPLGPTGLQSTVRGIGKGLSFGFSDELRAIDEAGGAKPGEPGSMLTTAKGLYNYWGGDPEAEKTYNESVARERAKDETYQQAHPYLSAAGEIAGALPAMAVLPEASLSEGLTGVGKAAAKIVEGAITGGEYGAVSGIGEGKDAESRTMGGLQGAASGIIGGGVAGGLSNAVSEAAAPVVGAIRAARDPEKEAATRLTRALQADQDLIASGKAEGMSPTDWIAARSRGEPVTLADLGSSNTQALLRWSANTSPEGRAILEKALNDRFAGQSERVADEVRGLVAGGANANKTADQLVAEYDAARAPAYKQAYREGDKEIISPTMERLMGSPTFETAMKSAISSGKDRAITEGMGAFNPGIRLDPGGAFVFTKTKPNGGPVYPNLQYWDSVKKELDGVANVARRQGDNGRAEVAGNLSKTLRDELDKQVPSYANARGIAAQYFGESNALEAGRKLAGKRVDPQDISDVMRKMKPDERELFREGYASDWANRVISNVSDSRDITKAMFNSPNERARALAVFGPAGMDKMQARMSLETIMDGARKAMGNSTTARQLIEAGLAGGITGYETGDWKSGVLAAGAAGMVPKVLGNTITQGAQKLIGKVDSRTAKMVAELLTSDDPARLQQGIRMASKNPTIKAGLMRVASNIGTATQQGVIRPYRGPNLGPLQGPVPAGAGNEQQKSNGP